MYTRLFIQYQAYTYTFFWIYDENVREAAPEAQALTGRCILKAVVISAIDSVLYMTWYNIIVYDIIYDIHYRIITQCTRLYTRLFIQYQASS